MSPSRRAWLSRLVLRLLLPWLPILLCLAYFTARDASSEPLPSATPLLPTIEIFGNERTRREVILAAAAIAPERFDALALARIRQRLLNLRLFERVEVSGDHLEAPAPVITIRVKERWTLFPIPFFSSSSRGVQGGLFLLETNLFGRNKTIVAGGSYASWGAAVFSFYQDPSVAGTPVTLRASLSYAENERQRRTGGDVVYQYEDHRFELLALPGLQFTRAMNLSIGAFASHNASAPMTASSPGEPAVPRPPAEGWLLGWAAGLDYRGADLRGYYDEGLTASALYKQARHALGASRDVFDLTARAAYTRAFFAGQATSVSAQVDLIEGDPIADVRLLGGRPGSRGFEAQTMWADRAATLTVQHQVPVLVRGWGIWTAVGFVDLGYAALEGRGNGFVTPGAGVRLHLPRTSFPAVGLDASYSLESDALFTTVSVGVTM